MQSLKTGLFIGGKWPRSAGAGEIVVFDPATGNEIARVDSANEVDGTLAVDAAASAGAGWAATPPRERAEILRRALELMQKNKDRLATIISLEEGKTFAEGRGEIDYASEFFRWYGEEAVRILGDFGRSPAGANHILVDQAPVGVSFLITPWNFPAAMATRKIAPALAAGCTVVLKPATETPLTALAVADLLDEAGVPPGVVTVLPSKRSADIADHVLSDARVSKLSFTVLTEVGRILIAKASERIINCSMELGGNAPFIVLDDADLDKTVDGALVAKLRNTGESCIGANCFYVHESVAELFTAKLAAAIAAQNVGPGLEEGVDIGPLVNEKMQSKVAELVDEAVAQGAKLLTGGKVPSGPGCFYPPTVLTNIRPDARIVNTEIFGPVAPIVPFSDVDEAIERANRTIFGLAAYVFGDDIGRALSVANRLDTGVIGINRGFVSDPAAPFGGTKQSGIGREGSQDGIHEFLEKKYIVIDW